MPSKFFGSDKITKLGQELKYEIKGEQDIMAKGLRPIMMESFVYSKSHGIGGICLSVGWLCWTWHSNQKQFKRVLSQLDYTQKLQQKIDDRSRKTILDCESVKIAMLVQA